MVQVHVTEKKLIQRFNFCLFCFRTQLITEGPMVLFQRKLYVSKAPGGPTPSRGWPNFFQGGSNCLFPKETHITCDFPGGPDPPAPSGSAHG